MFILAKSSSYSAFFLFLKVFSCIHQKIPCLIDHICGDIFPDSCIYSIVSEDTFFKAVSQPAMIFWVKLFRFGEMFPIRRNYLTMLIKFQIELVIK